MQRAEEEKSQVMAIACVSKGITPFVIFDTKTPNLDWSKAHEVHSYH